MVRKLFEELSTFDEVEAIALGGSRAGDNFDEKSDYDVYLYCVRDIPEKAREDVLRKYCSRIEIGNRFWEYEDNCTLNDGIDIDILYRNLDDFARGISEVVDKYQAQNGYTTCMWHNLYTCKIIYDREKRLTSLQEKYTRSYPQELKKNIIERNMKLLRYAMPAYEIQIAKAVKRNDIVSINHRVTEFMASYFDIIFAQNELTHPGEKRLVELCEKNCSILPQNFRENIDKMYRNLYQYPERVQGDIDNIINELEKVLD